MTQPRLLEAYPLTWPERQRRTTVRRIARFEVGFTTARDELLGELRKLGARDVVISSNVPLRRDGLPLADAREPTDPGVAVYFDRRGSKGEWVPFVIACDAYNRVRWNLRAVGLTVEALRSIARHGATEMLEQAFTGFAALPAAGGTSLWWVVLGVAENASVEEIREAYRRQAREHHPDRGGDPERMVQINRAHEAALRERGAA